MTIMDGFIKSIEDLLSLIDYANSRLLSSQQW